MPRKQILITTAQVSAQDAQLMEWLARWKQATAPQVARRFGLSQQAVYKRFARLESLKLVAHNKLLNGVYASYFLTADGYKYISSPYSFVEPTPTTVMHGLGVVDIGVEQEVIRPGSVLSEREIAVAIHAAKLTLGKHNRRRGTDYTPLRGLGPWTVYDNIVHSPDLVVTDEKGRMHSGEFEATAKSDSKLKAVLIGYITDREVNDKACRWTSVVYFCTTPGQVTRVNRIAAELIRDYSAEGLTIFARLYEPAHSMPVEAGEWGRDKPNWLRQREAAARATKRLAERAAGTATF
jgi:hypothetical protein